MNTKEIGAAVFCEGQWGDDKIDQIYDRISERSSDKNYGGDGKEDA